MAIKYSRSNRVAFARAVLRAQDKIAAKHQRKISAELLRAYREYAAAVNTPSKFGAITKAHRERMDAIVAALALETAKRFALVPINGIKAAKPTFDTALAEVAYEYVLKQAAKRVVGISKKTEADVRRVLANGLAAELTNTDIAKRLLSVGSISSRSRAATIARTEVHSAANTAEFTLLEEAGVKTRREWIATNDDRVRDAHSEADGQIVDVGEPFVVNGEKLMYPGDPAGSGHNIINCRCVVGYVIVPD